MSSYFKNIFLGTLIVFIDINVGYIDIIPDFIGYLIIISALSNLYNKTNIKQFFYAQLLSIVNLVFSILAFFYPINYSVEVYIPSLNLSFIYISALVEITIFFTFYSGIIKLVKYLEYDKAMFEGRQTLAAIVGFLQLINLSLIPVVDDSLTVFLLIVLIVANLIVYISYLSSINDMKKIYEEREIKK
ncbi:hypothetical protein KHQ82_01785 [Mycoplasmatota bacterium]|nr:hypothetical protein KHQ82_01785 [Mycoplasmatota bacterium]